MQKTIICENKKYQSLMDNYNCIASNNGFNFLNSDNSIFLEEEMRVLGNKIINNKEFESKVDIEIRKYEESMLKNIYSYCNNKSFNTAVFMCGVAHRKSIIEKIEEYKLQNNSNIEWEVYLR